jgi:two-component system, cell cycle sensor histidine kinase and response regulator CckA
MPYASSWPGGLRRPLLQAGDGREALRIIEQGSSRVDLVITDVAMPAMNGRELAHQLKRIRPHLPVLFISGYTDDEMVRRGLLEPDNPFLSKPFTPEILASKVRQLIDQAVTRSAGRALHNPPS